MPELVSAWALVFLMNAVTFPLPPALTVMAAYYATVRVPLLPSEFGRGAAVCAGMSGGVWGAVFGIPALAALLACADHFRPR